MVFSFYLLGGFLQAPEYLISGMLPEFLMHQVSLSLTDLGDSKGIWARIDYFRWCFFQYCIPGKVWSIYLN